MLKQPKGADRHGNPAKGASTLKLGLFVYDDTLESRHLLADLSADEHDRYTRHRGARQRRQYLASRWLVRQHLAADLAVSPGEIEIVYPSGRPPYCPDTPLQLGLSHSGPACLCLLHRQTEAGCDIEHVRARRIDPERLAQSYFAPEEVRVLCEAPVTDRLADFYRLWTLKEAQLKALGLGLGAGLARPTFVLRPRLRCLAPLTTTPWFFGALDLELPVGRLALAIASRFPVAGILLQRFEPAGPGRCLRTAITQQWQTTAVRTGL